MPPERDQTVEGVEPLVVLNHHASEGIRRQATGSRIARFVNVGEEHLQATIPS